MPSKGLAQATGTVTVLRNFNTNTGIQPLDGIKLRASDGNFYGCTSSGGSGNHGTIYQYIPGGAIKVLHSFVQESAITNPVQEGDSPKELIEGDDGNLYGICRGGGQSVNTPAGGGTFFTLAKDGTGFRKLFDFDNGPEAGAGTSSFTGVFPSAIVQGADGNFYGLTRDGGMPTNQGTYFRLSSGGSTRTELFAFRSGNGPGWGPEAQMIIGSDGNFYGITNHGGATGGTASNGAIFVAKTDGSVTPIHVFVGDNDPYSFLYALIQGNDGAFYGTSTYGGTSSGSTGTVFRCTADGDFKFLHVFGDAEIDGVEPRGGLVQGSDGNFYGSTNVGFAPDPADLRLGPGSFYQVTPGGGFTTLAKLVLADGEPQNPLGSLTEVSPGNFVSVVQFGPGNDASLVNVAVTGGSTSPAFFAGQAALGGGAYYLSFPSGNYFGYYSFLADPNYIFHYDLGYEYIFDAADGKSGVYFYDFKSGGFFYTSPGFPFPYLYDFSLNSVVYYYPDTTTPGHYNTNGFRFFYVFNTGAIISK